MALWELLSHSRRNLRNFSPLISGSIGKVYREDDKVAADGIGSLSISGDRDVYGGHVLPRNWPNMKINYFYPITAAWVVLIFYLGTIPNSFPESGGDIDYIQKLGHFATHFVLAALIYLLVSRGAASLAISARAMLVAVVYTLVVGALLESAQLFAPSRSAEVLDILFDGLGAVIGVSTIQALDTLKIKRAHTRMATAGTAIIGIAILGMGTVITGSAAIPRFADCNGILRSPSTAVLQTKVYTPKAGDRVSDGLIVLYNFSEGSGSVVHDVSRVEPALDLEILDPERVKWISGFNGVEFTEVGSAIRSMSSASKLYELITASNQLTIEAWVTPENLSQVGPVRIVTMSEGIREDQVNFHMGQSSRHASFRLRTICHSRNRVTILEALADTATPQHLVMTYDGVSPRMFANGETQSPTDLPTGDFVGKFSNWDPDYPLIIGNEASLDRSYLGKFHLIAIYDRALSGDEVRHNFNVGLVDTG